MEIEWEVRKEIIKEGNYFSKIKKVDICYVYQEFGQGW